ncbi:DUF7010 family protein [Alteromonas facilis]|uniref:DUF7010 family protein n=1 Tax=Alteromonas facilis TaxID=2048004 RepID=UPI000C294C85|nr:hypothetical protein [Alteromonas facilis]
MEFTAAQDDMKRAYAGGSTGVLASGMVWTIAAITGLVQAPFASMLVLFFGGMLIFPLSVLLAKILGRSGRHASDNPLRFLAIETLAILFAGLLLAFYFANIAHQYFYPIMLITIGIRYIVFQSLYGEKLYWVLGALLTVSGVASLLLNAPFIIGAFIGGGCELLFALMLLRKYKGNESLG